MFKSGQDVNILLQLQLQSLAFYPDVLQPKLASLVQKEWISGYIQQTPCHHSHQTRHGSW